MNCEQFQKRIFDPATEESDLHRKSCKECFAFSCQIDREADLLSKSMTPEPPADLWSTLESKIKQDRPIPRGRVASWIGIAAALLVGVTGLLFMEKSVPPEKKESLQLNVVEVSPEASKALSGFIPGYDQEDAQQALANAMVPFPYRRDR